MDTQGQPWEWSVSALSPLNGTRNRKPPCARLGVPAGTAMQGKRQNWISLPSITTATLAAFPWRSSHPHRICSFQTESKEGRGGEKDLKIATSNAINRLPNCPCTWTPGSHAAQGRTCLKIPPAAQQLVLIYRKLCGQEDLGSDHFPVLGTAEEPPVLEAALGPSLKERH